MKDHEIYDIGRLSRRATIAGLLGFAVAACSSSPTPSASLRPVSAVGSSDGLATQQIYVTNIGWHTGIAVPRAAVVASGRIPEIAAFSDVVYIEFGWGDRDYYTSADPTIFQALAAGFARTPSVLHLIGMPVPPQRFYAQVDVLTVPVTDVMLGRLLAYIDAEFDRQGAESAAPLPSALVRGAFFYPAKSEFHLFNTCNTWVARTLAEAGVDMSPRGVITADDLMDRLAAIPGVRPAG